jgi:hypothetical protein
MNISSLLGNILDAMFMLVFLEIMLGVHRQEGRYTFYKENVTMLREPGWNMAVAVDECQRWRPL